jgi:hypothetical protein
VADLLQQELVEEIGYDLERRKSPILLHVRATPAT